ncbi:hypothetical protein L914_06688 [Phytophthora nicotianae]|uniref:Uncharacterized protein n=1 Tax=Phytophthora nicotianae TaxID=4792 RepID=W2NLN8_PHYNI|nr:hypothetical protein L914_06688 [Phytophthora nicotianae]
MTKRAASEAFCGEEGQYLASDNVLQEQKRQRKAQYMREYRAARKIAGGSRIGAVHNGGEEHDVKRRRERQAGYMRNYRAKQKRGVDTEGTGNVGPTDRSGAGPCGQANGDISINDRLQALAESILHKHDISGEELSLMMKGQNFTSDPRLALAYYYCCAGQPDAFVFNDEHVRDDELVRERLLNAMDAPPGLPEYERCQASSAASDPANFSIFACASCCEFLLGPESGHVCLPLSLLSQSFQISSEEFAKRYGHLSMGTVRKHAQILLQPDGRNYYLNPELVRDTERVHLCSKCAYNPRKSKFSIANGHDYGRYDSLPDLSPIAKNCISPAWCFGLEFSVSGKHCSGHAICFPSGGPQACAKVLPSTDIERKPRVTFIGPSEEWRAKKHLFRGLYELPSIQIDDSTAGAERLASLQDSIENGVIVSDAAALHAVDNAVNSERYGYDIVTGESPEVVIQQSAVLQPAMRHSDKMGSVIIDAMIDAVGTQEEVAVVRRGSEPIVEWDENGSMIAGAFPTLFMMGGDMLPSGSFPQDLVQHLMRYYDGRFESNVSLIATLFNQLQRHAAIRKTARAVTTHAKTLQKLGKLANSDEFKESLLTAARDPDSPTAKRLNAGLLRLLSVVGGTVPFSPFERAATRPKLAAMRFRFGLPQFWVTVAPPEQDDTTLHRVMLLRKLNAWNDDNCVYTREHFQWELFPQNLKESPSQRLSISTRCPALAALMFERQVKLLQKSILRCPASQDVRKSRNYTEREAGAYGRVAGFNAVVEPQVDGRLHLHMTVYGSSFTPEILTRGASCQELREYIAKWINAVSTNHLSPSTRAWLAERECMEPLPRACEVTLPPVSTNFAAFQDTIEASVVATNIHNHSRTCIKGKRGKTQCRLCRPAGIHNLPTQPLHISKSDGVLTGKSLNPELEVKLDAGYDPEQGEFLRPHIPGPIVWEQFRPESDGMFIETNLLLSGLTASHCSSSIMNGEDAGDMVDEHQQNYMTKEGAGLKNAAAVMLTALEDVLKYPSVALNSGTPIRQAQYLATRTVNAFGGAHEWPLSLMVYALLGHKSYISSEAFWYIFPHGFMDELRKMEMNEVNDDHDTSDSESGSLEDDEGPIGDDFDVDSGSDSADEGGLYSNDAGH